MELQQYKFCYAGSNMNFTVFADAPCHIRYVKSIPIPIGQTQVELYEIEPGTTTKWVVVKQVNGHKATLIVFLRRGKKVLENSIAKLSREIKSEIMQRFPKLAAEPETLLAASI